jgi:hypothetical protein
MRQTKVMCDRCGGCIVDQGSILEVTAGQLRQRFTQPIDLCSDCGGLFASFIQSGRASHTATGTGIPAPPPSLATPAKL